MDEKQLVQYLQDNLRIRWLREEEDLFVALTLGNKIISRIKFGVLRSRHTEKGLLITTPIFQLPTSIEEGERGRSDYF